VWNKIIFVSSSPSSLLGMSECFHLATLRISHMCSLATKCGSLEVFMVCRCTTKRKVYFVRNLEFQLSQVTKGSEHTASSQQPILS